MSPPVTPKTAWFTVNRACQFRCRWCYAADAGFRPDDDMSWETASRLVEICRNSGVNQILIIGGEPLLWRPLLEFNRLCADSGLRTVLVTNALRFSSDRFWESYLESPSYAVGISLKAANSKQLQELTGAACFDEMCRGVSRAVTHYRCGVSATYNSCYTGSLVDLTSLAVKLGASSFKIDFCKTVFEQGCASSKYMIEPRQLVSQIVADYPRLVEATGGRITFELNSPLCLWPRHFIDELRSAKRISTVCHVHKRMGVVFGTRGEVQVCNGLFDWPIAALHKEFHDSGGLLRVLNTPETLSVYDELHRYPLDQCESCELYPVCAGGCPLLWAVYRPEDLLQPRQ